MTVKEWVNYYEDTEQHKQRLLNVISLEFSHTRLEDYIDQPQVVCNTVLHHLVIRVITSLENLEMSGNLKHVRDFVSSQGTVMLSLSPSGWIKSLG